MDFSYAKKKIINYITTTQNEGKAHSNQTNTIPKQGAGKQLMVFSTIDALKLDFIKQKDLKPIKHTSQIYQASQVHTNSMQNPVFISLYKHHKNSMLC
jgi:hypothetical protein